MASSPESCEPRPHDGAFFCRGTESLRLPLVAVIPAFEAELTVGAVVCGARRHGIAVWVGDDGSLDQTGRAAAEAGARVIRHDHNRGKGAMLRTLFEAVRAEVSEASAVVTLDADGQHDPADISEFWECHRKHPSALLLGNRFWQKQRIPPLRYWANRAATGLLSFLAGEGLSDSQCGFRLVPVECLARLETRQDRFVMETELLVAAFEAGIVVRAVPIRTIYAHRQTSHFRSIRDAAAIGGFLGGHVARRAWERAWLWKREVRRHPAAG